MASVLGTILNKSASIPRVTAVFSTDATYTSGLVFENGAADWRMAPVDGSVNAQDLYWLETGFTIAAGEPNKKVTVYAIEGLQVIGQADGAIVVGALVKSSTTASHNGQLESHTIRTDTVANAVADLLDTLGHYMGHEDEIREGVVVRADAVDEDTDCVFLLGAGV